jgi:hypothetical protein
LDWVHITMRITVMKQMAKGLKTKELAASATEIEKKLESMKWHLWHDRELCCQQTLCEETANALDPARRSPAAANPCIGSECRPAGNLLPMVPRNEIGGESYSKSSGIEARAPRLNRSPICMGR